MPHGTNHGLGEQNNQAVFYSMLCYPSPLKVIKKFNS